jgi:very-short-patch-repair endonuclease
LEKNIKKKSNRRNKQLFGLKFFRQFGVGPFTIDFYCPALHLAIEIDGGQHAENQHKIYDQRRTDFLKQKDITVIRFWDNEVLNNIEGVLEKITGEVSKLK